MRFQFLTPRLHGLLDYAAAAGLIVFPFLLGLGQDSAVALWFSVAAGVGLIGYSLLTDYSFSVVPLLPYDVHLGLDLAAAAAFIAAPYVFGFATLTSIYYFVMAAGVTAVVAVSDRRPVKQPAAERTTA